MFLKKYKMEEKINDIVINEMKTMAVDKISISDLNESYLSKIRFIMMLEKQYENDTDLGRNLRIFLRTI